MSRRNYDFTPDDLLAYGRVDVTDDCWVWGRSRWEKGYGRVGEKRAHRVMWESVNGPIVDDLQVLHHCDNPPCVRPDHLFLGTQLDNMHDMIAKGRKVVRSGETHPFKDPERRAAMSGDNHWTRRYPELMLVLMLIGAATVVRNSCRPGTIFGDDRPHGSQDRTAVEHLVTDRLIRENEHELFPDKEFNHLNCEICGPDRGPLYQAADDWIQHPFYKMGWRQGPWKSDG